MLLHAITTSAGSGEAGSGGAFPPLVILHGLFGSARNWSTIAKRLAARRDVIAFDLRNHGASPQAGTMDYPAMAEDVAQSLDALGASSVDLAGHSMGGKVAMALSLEAPTRVRHLAVIDIAPMPYTRSGDTGGLGAYAEAMARLPLPGEASRAALSDALAAEIPDPSIRGFLMQNLVRGPGHGLGGGGEAGMWHWRLNLPAILAAMPGIIGWSDPPNAGAYRGPSLFLRGGQSSYVPDESLPAIRRLFPGARIVTVDAAGHWVHAERPDEFVAALTGFFGI